MGVRLGSLDTIRTPIEITNYCPTDLSKIYSQDSLQLRSFPVAELVPQKKINLQLRAYVDFYGGYAEHGREVLFRLDNSGKFAIRLEPIKSLVDIDPMLWQKSNFFCHNPAFKFKDSIFLAIAGPGWGQEKFLPKDRYSILWTMIESENCHPKTKDWVGDVNELWVPTSCDERRFSKVFDKELKVIPLGFNENYNPGVLPVSFRNIKRNFVFGFIGSWNKRKGIKTIIRSFCNAFSIKDPVSLLLITKYGTRPYDGVKDGEFVKKEDKKWDIKYEFDRYVSDFKKDLPHICLVDIPIHESIMPNVYASVDCLVGCSMGESTWLPGLNAFAMRKAVIQSLNGCNGCIDYMTESNCYAITGGQMVIADEELYKGTSEYYEGCKFWQSDESELTETMLRVFTERKTYAFDRKCILAYESVQKRTWNFAIQCAINRLEEIGARNGI